MPSRDIEAAYPLSAMQQGMLFHHVSSGDSAVDIMQLVASLHEDLQPARFRLAWECVVARHPVLRTSFRWTECEEPLQEVHKEVAVPFEVLDWHDIPADEHPERIEAYLQADRQRGFNLSQPPLMRLTVVRLGQDHYKCIWTRHHIILDGGSYPTVLNEVFGLYAGLCGGRVPELAPVPSFQEYIEWLEGQDWTTAEDFWRERLKGFGSTTQFPPLVSSADPGEHRPRRGREEMTLTETETSALKAFAASGGITVNTVLNGAWAVLLSRYSGEADVVFGGTRACRHSTVEGADSMVGLLINTLPVRLTVLNDQPLLPWLRGLLEQWMSITLYEHTPLTNVRAWSGVPGQKPLFDSFVVFNNRSLNAILQAKGGGWLNRKFELHGETNLPMAVTAYLDDRLEMKIGFDTQRFSAETIRRMLVHLKTILLSMADSPQQTLGELRMLPEEERRQILLEWNDTTTDYGACDTLHGLVERQTTLAPDAIAVHFEGQELTYYELEQRANQVANYLRRLGVDTETLVGLYLDRSLDLVVGVLGILKAGGAFVPLDPDLPAARLQVLVEDGRIPIVITHERLCPRLAANAADVVRLDADWPAIRKESCTKPTEKAAGENLAYVVYTSGSTGTPKAAMNEHRGISNHTLTIARAFGLGPADVCVLKTPLSFDPWISEVFRSLVAGACLVVARPGGHRDIRYLVDLIDRHGVASMNFVPSMLREALEIPDLERCTSLKHVISGGEALTRDLVTRFRARMTARLHNVYGPAETSIGVCLHECTGNEMGLTVPIGHPIANTRLYVLDPELEPVPAGVVGELYIAGVHVGRGYLHRPDLTEQKFLPDTFAGDPRAKMYKTGDLARYLFDGSIEFHGRRDLQTKVRGVRIELEEIEACLARHEMIAQAAVTVSESISGDRRLIGYFTSRPGVEPQEQELRRFLVEFLPPDMVPSLLIQLERFPLTPSGKIDRAALSVPEDHELAVDEDVIEPRNVTESKVLAVWEEVLQLKVPGVYQNFFDLGGHSLLATRVINRIRRDISIEVPLSVFFEHPTVADIARYVASVDRDDSREITTI
jgi:microcystin synthetase protein McyB